MRSDNQMTPRSPIAVFAYSILTLGIYQWYWLVKTKGELNRSQAKVAVPTAFVWLIPIVGGVWWYWKYAEAVDEVTHGKYSTPVSFLIIWLLGTIGCAIMQYAFNESHEQPIVTQPTNSTGDGYGNPYAPNYSQPSAQPTAPAPRYRAGNPHPSRSYGADTTTHSFGHAEYSQPTRRSTDYSPRLILQSTSTTTVTAYLPFDT